MKVVAIIQARMGSSRLPAKVMKRVLDKSLLEYQLERVKRTMLIDEIVIATTTRDSEQPIVDLCEKLSIALYRGSEDDVLSRYYEAAREFKADIVVRLTSDCPIIDPNIIDNIIEQFINNKCDYVSNTLKRTYPRGYDTEVFSFETLESAYLNGKSNFEREHVTPYIYQNQSSFNIEQMLGETDNSHYRLTVDTIEDFILIEKIISTLYVKNNNFTNGDVMELLKRNKDWKQINSDINQKKN
ncbi:cytidylyltransferase domain-containing protein [Jeotgalibacillus salarius]|uniref:Acylneuraminate cytidylyltransferase n=1 Tax=Jeotgalibacillus salarius TaxID=546023 RepID=A0A4Y8LLV6_9BACL|nr:glycosyltransferase family protein [Jeotgalibacillus salarius]TFE03936.1 acylneuraminate cytidylyltransferase [Jeotgalibacillus salarius]